MKDFVTFRRMITPAFMIVAWAMATIAVIIWGLVLIFDSDGGGIGELGQAIGFVVLILGPIAVRVFFEILIVVFSINENLTDIKNLIERQRYGGNEPS